MQTSEDCDDLECISWERRNLEIKIRMSNDPEYLDAYHPGQNSYITQFFIIIFAIYIP